MFLIAEMPVNTLDLVLINVAGASTVRQVSLIGGLAVPILVFFLAPKSLIVDVVRDLASTRRDARQVGGEAISRSVVVIRLAFRLLAARSGAVLGRGGIGVIVGAEADVLGGAPRSLEFLPRPRLLGGVVRVPGIGLVAFGPSVVVVRLEGIRRCERTGTKDAEKVARGVPRRRAPPLLELLLTGISRLRLCAYRKGK